MGTVKFTDDMFLLPDGSPMSPSEICDYLNDVKDAVVPTKKELPPVSSNFGRFNLTLNGRFATIPIRMGNNFAPDEGLYPTTSYREQRVSLYTESIMEQINQVVYNKMTYDVRISSIAVSYEVFINLEMELDLISQHSTTDSYSRRYGLIILTPVGEVNVFIADVASDQYVCMYNNKTDFFKSRGTR